MDEVFIMNVGKKEYYNLEKKDGMRVRKSIYFVANSFSHSNDPLLESVNKNKIAYRNIY
jgi:hypothetical protein